ncbi:hypothetical protein NDU88_004152 [Pleurodeles waltl]|uniref:Uncharacterized protein n=1 Tax=Pleurodeles waltl TaxID=8319 RepID=A0AAV7KXJ3_PLEWA|nr:hypothetical protein NDU88_004152 [Pleurodeles waltl]
MLGAALACPGSQCGLGRHGPVEHAGLGRSGQPLGAVLRGGRRRRQFPCVSLAFPRDRRPGVGDAPLCLRGRR